MRAIYPGSFNPISLGHLDIIHRASKIFEHLLILVADNHEKSNQIGSEERIKLIKESIGDLNNVEVRAHKGLVVDYAKTNGYKVLLRGIRGASDFESELEMSQINHALSDGLETIFLMTSPQHSFIRSSRVWELVRFGGDLSKLVPANVAVYLTELLKNDITFFTRPTK
ncbi:MAG: pantetheine-phosphate adenylyltransferase [Candidatus Caenarcaniphilales bacterium]|jgi:pantetheine-phosphate adenylyltransferase|nr:pantetheine-phosphate adenylyltransferase [Candidatus Caenarcaniphilales bacterium]